MIRSIDLYCACINLHILGHISTCRIDIHYGFEIDFKMFFPFFLAPAIFSVTFNGCVSQLTHLLSLAVIICVKGCLVEERQALLRLRASLNDSEAHFKSWEGMECCRWRGVNCSFREAKHVVTLDLHGFQLSTVIDVQMDFALFQLR